MKLPRDVSGRDLVFRLGRAFGYAKVHQVGSHIILQIERPLHHRIAVPDHRTLRAGTVNSIVRVIARRHGLSRAEVLGRLFG